MEETTWSDYCGQPICHPSVNEKGITIQNTAMKIQHKKGDCEVFSVTESAIEVIVDFGEDNIKRVTTLPRADDSKKEVYRYVIIAAKNENEVRLEFRYPGGFIKKKLLLAGGDHQITQIRGNSRSDSLVILENAAMHISDILCYFGHKMATGLCGKI